MDAPKPRAMLRLKNGSSDQAVRLIARVIEYLDGGGKPIALAKDRGDTTFRVSSHPAERLDSGTATSHDIDVPFPAAAVNGKALADVRLSVTHIPSAYREDSLTVPLVLGGTGAAK